MTETKKILISPNEEYVLVSTYSLDVPTEWTSFKTLLSTRKYFELADAFLRAGLRRLEKESLVDE